MKRGLIGIALLAAGLPGPAWSAVQYFDLRLADSTTGFSGTMGTIKVQESAGSLLITETLNAGYRIHDTTSTQHEAFYFSLAGDPAVSITDLSAKMSRAATVDKKNHPITSYDAPPWGSFDYAIQCSGCSSGWSGGASGLSFKVTANTGTLSLASLAFNLTGSGQKVYFASDLISSATGKTGNVGAVLRVASTPEPATWAMMILGFGAVGTTMRRRRTSLA